MQRLNVMNVTYTPQQALIYCFVLYVFVVVCLVLFFVSSPQCISNVFNQYVTQMCLPHAHLFPNLLHFSFAKITSIKYSEAHEAFYTLCIVNELLGVWCLRGDGIHSKKEQKLYHKSDDGVSFVYSL